MIIQLKDSIKAELIGCMWYFEKYREANGGSPEIVKKVHVIIMKII